MVDPTQSKQMWSCCLFLPSTVKCRPALEISSKFSFNSLCHQNAYSCILLCSESEGHRRLVIAMLAWGKLALLESQVWVGASDDLARVLMPLGLKKFLSPYPFRVWQVKHSDILGQSTGDIWVHHSTKLVAPQLNLPIPRMVGAAYGNLYCTTVFGWETGTRLLYLHQEQRGCLVGYSW